ncbi:MAG: hypothetical protein RBR74_03165, partial [Ignavibacteriaceae bacterium]|nr:hypothetical protein [Ignavibacteriaceae bacterium]
MNWKFLNSGLNSGRFNMDFDLFLSENIEPDTFYFRLYQWHPFCISIGINQSEDDVDLKKAKYNLIDIVKRPTGGSAFMHAAELSYSVIYSVNEKSIAENYTNEIYTALKKGLIIFDPKLSEIEIKYNQSDFNEFYNDKSGDVVSVKNKICLNNKIFVRSTQRKIDNIILEQGSLLCENYYQNIVEYLKVDNDRKNEMLNEIRTASTDL